MSKWSEYKRQEQRKAGRAFQDVGFQCARTSHGLLNPCMLRAPITRKPLFLLPHVSKKSNELILVVGRTDTRMDSQKWRQHAQGLHRLKPEGSQRREGKVDPISNQDVISK